MVHLDNDSYFANDEEKPQGIPTTQNAEGNSIKKVILPVCKKEATHPTTEMLWLCQTK